MLFHLLDDHQVSEVILGVDADAPVGSARQPTAAPCCRSGGLSAGRVPSWPPMCILLMPSVVIRAGSCSGVQASHYVGQSSDEWLQGTNSIGGGALQRYHHASSPQGIRRSSIQRRQILTGPLSGSPYPNAARYWPRTLRMNWPRRSASRATGRCPRARQTIPSLSQRHPSRDIQDFAAKQETLAFGSLEGESGPAAGNHIHR